jgi:hypothetical protein
VISGPTMRIGRTASGGRLLRHLVEPFPVFIRSRTVHTLGLGILPGPGRSGFLVENFDVPGDSVDADPLPVPDQEGGLLHAHDAR